uniref:ERVV2 protein n=1 Tax=Gopherus evgoodei TaxID=1825980 RepID=A0A8C4VPF1_9SAUR
MAPPLVKILASSLAHPSYPICGSLTPIQPFQLFHGGGAIIRLQGLLESLTNETATLFENQAGEMSQLRQLALQNRMALDMMLAAQEGTCALINEECCVFVNNTYSDTFQCTKHLRKMAKNYSSGQGE